MDTETDNPTDDDFEEFIDTDQTIEARVQKPIGEVMDAQGSYETALRHQVGSGTVEGVGVEITIGMDGTVRIEFEDGLSVHYELDAMAAAAASAREDVDIPFPNTEDDE